jgi:hypothetical protein
MQCCKGKLSVSNAIPDKEGGLKLGFGLGNIYGTIRLTELKGRRISESEMEYSWLGWGRPNLLIEPGMQWVAERTSVHIWHRPVVRLSCVAGKGFFEIKSFGGSKFPSRRLWVNGDLQKDTPQGTFGDLWTPSEILGEEYVK